MHSRFSWAFDDVLLVPQYSEINPGQVSLGVDLGHGIKLAAPVISAPMDTVTDDTMAIAMAHQGGFGIIHRGMSAEQQAMMVEKVKRFESVIITDPFTLQPHNSIQVAKENMLAKGISGIPITDENGMLKGIVTKRDIMHVPDSSLELSTAMTTEVITATPSIKPRAAYKILIEHKIEKLPLIGDDGTLLGMITSKDIKRKDNYPHETIDIHGRLVVGGAVGTARNAKERCGMLIEAGCDIIAVDAAHGHTRNVLDMIKYIKENHIHTPVIGGNIATYEGAAALEDAGADIIKIGVGAASICTTRIIAGVGVPQLAAIINSKLGTRMPTIADGGIRYSGDAIKALAAGASCIMIGRLLAGMEEAPGNKVIRNGQSYKVYRGMGSLAGMSKFSNDRYGRKTSDSGKTVPEGIEGHVPYTGPLAEFMYQFLGGIRAGMGYIGAKNIPELWEKSRFIEISNSGLVESHPHSISFSDAPNYRRHE